MADHPSLDDLADAAEGLLDPARAARVAAHVAGCADCAEAAAALSGVTAVLAAEPEPGPMPAGVSQRLDDVLAAESAHRAAAAAGARAQPAGAHGPPAHRASLGHFELQRRPPPWWRRWAPVLAAAALACVVGLGGYVGSATAGLNEPPQVAANLSSADLARQADALAQSRDLDPHRFSQAWLCARSVTAGRITGLARARVDGGPVLLVYLRSEGAASVTVVTGCGSAAPDVVASAALPG